jgi:hypothetical protein
VNRQTVIIVVVVVLLVHVALFYAAVHMRSLPVVKPVPRPNFGESAQVYIDAETGQKFTYREIHVSTKLADAETLKRLEAERTAKPPPPPPPTP